MTDVSETIVRGTQTITTQRVSEGRGLDHTVPLADASVRYYANSHWASGCNGGMSTTNQLVSRYSNPLADICKHSL